MAKTDKLIRIILKLEDQVSKTAEQAASKLDKVSGSLRNVGGVLTAGVTAPLVAFGAMAANTAIQMESAFAGVIKTVDGTEEQLADLRKELDTLATSVDSPVAALDNAQAMLYEIAEAAGQLGVQREDIAAFTDTLAQLAMTTDIIGEEGARALAQFANVAQFDLSNVQQLGDVIATLGNNLATTESQILTFGQRMGTLSNVGLAAEEILAFGGAMASMGINAELGSTNFVRAVNEMAIASAQGGAALEHVAGVANMAAGEFAQMMQSDPAGAIQAFVEGLSGMNLDQQVAALDAMGLTGTEVQRVFMSLAGNTDLLAQSLEMAGTAIAGNGALLEEASKRADTTAGQINLLKNNLGLLADQLGQALLPTINRLIELLIPIVQAFIALPAPVKELIVGFAALAAALGPVMMIVGSLSTAFGAISTAVTAAGAALGVVSAPVLAIGAAIVAVVAGIALLIANFDKVKDAAAKVWEALKAGLERFGQLGTVILETAKAIGTKFIEAVKNLVPMALEIGKQLLMGLINGIKQKAVELINAARKIAQDAANAIKNALGIRSPSRVMMKMGEQVVAGFNKGIESMGGIGVSVNGATLSAGGGGAAAAPAAAGGGGYGVYINNLTVPPGTTREQVDYIARELAKRAVLKGASRT